MARHFRNTDLKCLCTRAIMAVIVMTAWDVVIDPGMARAGYWVWEHGGSYFGVPRHNFVGWLVTTFTVYVVSACSSDGSSRFFASHAIGLHFFRHWHMRLLRWCRLSIKRSAQVRSSLSSQWAFRRC